MASDSALNAVQIAIITLLKADTTLIGRLGAGAASVTDYVAPTAAYPYIVVGDQNEVPDNVFAREKREVDAALHVWDQSRGWKVGGLIAGDLLRLLDFPAQLVVTGWPAAGQNFTVARWMGNQRFRDPDGVTRHHVVNFRFYVEQ